MPQVLAVHFRLGNHRYNVIMKKAWVYQRKHIKGWWCGGAEVLYVCKSFLMVFLRDFAEASFCWFRASTHEPCLV